MESSNIFRIGNNSMFGDGEYPVEGGRLIIQVSEEDGWTTVSVTQEGNKLITSVEDTAFFFFFFLGEQTAKQS